MLATLGFRIPAKKVDAILGYVASYPWTDDFTHAWQQLPRAQRRGGAPVRPAYRQLLTGLTAAHGHPVKILDGWQLNADDRNAGIQGAIISAHEIDPFILTTCLRTFEQQLHRGGADPNTLAPVLPAVDTSRRFGDAITISDSRTAVAPGWLFESATWAVMTRLAAQPLRLEDNGPRLPLRLDTDGSLLAWDDLVTNPWQAYTGRAMLRITARIVTINGLDDLVIAFDAHLSRINDQWRGAKNTWIERRDPTLPVLHVPVRHLPPAHEGDPWNTEVANYAAVITQACGLERLDLDQDLPEVPGRLRPLIPKPRKHPVGKGPGPRLMLRLAEHIQRYCADLEPLHWTKDKHTKIKAARRQILIAPASKAQEKAVRVDVDTITAAVRAAGLDRLRVVCLYDTPEARHRMTQQLREVSSTPLRPDGDISWLNDGMGVSFHRVPELLAHGRKDRRALAAPIEAIARSEPGAVVAWVETEYDPRTGPVKDDAKLPLRRVLAEMRIASQVLATAPPVQDDMPTTGKRRRPQNAGAVDHSMTAGAADLLLRIPGVIHPDLAPEILLDFLEPTPHTDVQLVGLHARLQKSGLDNVPAKLVLTATVIQASKKLGKPWPVRMWSDQAGQWVPQPLGIAAFHATAIGSSQHGRHKDKAAATRIHIEGMLDALPPGPVVLYLDAQGFRTIYPGLQNHHFGNGTLPGVTLGQHRDLAIVRCNSTTEVPRPVNRDGGHQPGDPRQPAAPDGYLYQLDQQQTWLLPRKSRQYKAKGGDIGARYSPWTIPEELRHLLKDDWHSYTGTEIAIARTGPWTQRALATLTARLCDHSIIWDDRTIAPIPLHLASRADRTHPEYRSDEEED
jgi:RNase H domain-containing protein/argonaute-like protein